MEGTGQIINGFQPDQILARDKVLLGHASVETTERYLGCKQKLRDAVNDHLGIEPESV